MADVYEKRSYAQVPIGFGHKPGIVVVDYQVGFTDPQYALGAAPFRRAAPPRDAARFRPPAPSRDAVRCP